MVKVVWSRRARHLTARHRLTHRRGSHLAAPYPVRDNTPGKLTLAALVLTLLPSVAATAEVRFFAHRPSQFGQWWGSRFDEEPRFRLACTSGTCRAFPFDVRFIPAQGLQTLIDADTLDGLSVAVGTEAPPPTNCNQCGYGLDTQQVVPVVFGAGESTTLRGAGASATRIDDETAVLVAVEGAASVSTYYVLARTPGVTYPNGPLAPELWVPPDKPDHDQPLPRHRRAVSGRASRLWKCSCAMCERTDRWIARATLGAAMCGCPSSTTELFAFRLHKLPPVMAAPADTDRAITTPCWEVATPTATHRR